MTWLNLVSLKHPICFATFNSAFFKVTLWFPKWRLRKSRLKQWILVTYGSKRSDLVDFFHMFIRDFVIYYRLFPNRLLGFFIFLLRIPISQGISLVGCLFPRLIREAVAHLSVDGGQKDGWPPKHGNRNATKVVGRVDRSCHMDCRQHGLKASGNSSCVCCSFTDSLIAELLREQY